MTKFRCKIINYQNICKQILQVHVCVRIYLNTKKKSDLQYLFLILVIIILLIITVNSMKFIIKH